MKRNRLTRIKAMIRKYKFQKAQAKNAMMDADLSSYIKMLSEVNAQRKSMVSSLVPVYANK